MSYESADDLKFYISHGYCPDNASKTLEWAFQDWGASRMAARLGNTRMHVCLKTLTSMDSFIQCGTGLGISEKEKW